MSSVSMSGVPVSTNPLKSKWVQLALGVICMMSISSPQYVWALFTKPIMGQLGVTLTELQVTFSILIVLQTFFSPFQGYLVDKFGPRLLLSIGTVLTGLSWSSRPTSPLFQISISPTVYWVDWVPVLFTLVSLD